VLRPRLTGRELPPVAHRIRDEVLSAVALAQAGFLTIQSPARMREYRQLAATYGAMGAGVPVAARRFGDRTAIIDERGSMTYRELDERSNALANAWHARGVRAGDGMALLVRNHRGFVETLIATQKLGARAILLNTDFAGPQLREVAVREGAQLLVYDEEFEPLLGELDLPLGSYRAWTDDEEPDATDTLEALIAGGDRAMPPAPSQHGSFIILTSGTTGTPKGARRDAEAKTLTRIGALVGSVPIRGGETMVIAAPLFHSLGFISGVLGLALGSTVVLRRRFSPDQVLRDVSELRAATLICVPIMLARILDAYEVRDPRPDMWSLRIVLVAGSQLGATLAQRTLDLLGDVIYNLYGSTEVAFATIAGPADLRAAPDTVGPPTLGSRIRILDRDGKRVPDGATGRIFVANAIPFQGYTGGGTKEVIDGMMSSGDLGHFDEHGRLYVDGRDDGMIISGGENVFPDEIEELLHGHASISEAAAIGVPDEEFGQRLRVFVVTKNGAALSEDEVRDYVKGNLARYKVPRDVVFLPELPRNPTGKVLKRELARHDG
jgi:fatty-acyl-CoA synthase